MASITMTASFLGGATLSTASSPATPRRTLVVRSTAKASAREDSNAVKLSYGGRKEDYAGSNGRRDVMFAAAAAAAFSIVGIAAAEDPKPGTPEAKKFYAPVCVTMPTARVCHK